MLQPPTRSLTATWCVLGQITTTKEAKKYYPLFGLGANVALIFSGQYVRLVSAFRASLPAHVDKWGVSLKLLMGEYRIQVRGCVRVWDCLEVRYTMACDRSR